MARPRSADKGWQIAKDCPFWPTVWGYTEGSRPRLGWEAVIDKDFKEMGTSWEGVKREALSRLGWRRSMRSCAGIRRLGAAVSY